MKTVFAAFSTLWPEQSWKALKPMLNKTYVCHYPAERKTMPVGLAKDTVVIVKDTELKEVVSLLENNFQHIVQEDRNDFTQELLASSLMIVKPEAFASQPIPFFFSGFQSAVVKDDPGRNLVLKFSKSREKVELLSWLKTFLESKPQTMGIRDLTIQAADELITNALFNAPVKASGVRLFADLPRDREIELPEGYKATLFANFSDERLLIGCVDPYGSIVREALLLHLRALYKEPASSMRSGHGGAGLGFRYLMENSANIYVNVKRGKSSVVACGFLLQGLKANLQSKKHIHFSFFE